MAWLYLRRLRLSANHCSHPVLHCMVRPPARVTHTALTSDHRKPLGEPNPSVANLALAIVLVVVASLQTVFVS